MPPENVSEPAGAYDWSWFPRGMANILSVPALVLISAFIGFGGLAREAGLPLAELIFMVPTIWALPSHLVMLAGIATGASIVPIALAVALASIRMMPMTMALIPEIRAPKSKPWHLVLVSNCVAITAWVHTLQKAPEIPREGRLPYFTGFATTMMVATSTAAAAIHQLAAAFPLIIMAGLYFLTPLYFAMTTWSTARRIAERYALVFGFILGPLIALFLPGANILIAGVLGGVGAFLLHLILNRKAAD